MEDLQRKLIEEPLHKARSANAKEGTPENIDKDLENFKKFMGESQ
jgi:hypothetical protein